jgi:hypothetical protein
MARADFGGGASGALSGAATGAAFGGPVGAGIGGIVGGLGGLFGSGRKKRKKRISSLDKDQQRLNQTQHQSILGEGPLADLYNYNPEQANSVFEQTISRPALREFKEETIPGITGSFRSAGLQNSSYVGDALSRAGRDVQEDLNAKRAKYLYDEQKQARSAKRSAVENLQNRQTFSYDTGAPRSGGFDIGSILQSISPDAIAGIRDYFNQLPAGRLSSGDLQ